MTAAPRGWARRATSVLLLLSAVSAMVLAGSTAPAGAASDDGPSAGAVQQLGACLASGKQGHVLLVLDNSLSLRETDPDFARVSAATYLVGQLATYVDGSGAKVDLAVTTFAESFDAPPKFTPLTGASASRFTDRLDALRTTKPGFETDYWNAVTGARKVLGNDGLDAADDCRAWVWFSDGQYSLDVRDSSQERDAYGTTKDYAPDLELTTAGAVAKAQRAGADDLCSELGASTALRGQGIITLAIGLQAPGGAAQDFSLMKGVAEGLDGCGGPTEQAPGSFVEAGDISDLLFAFDTISDPAHPAQTTTTGLCQTTPCADPALVHRFVLDSSISTVHVLAGADDGSGGAISYAIELTPPGGPPVRIDPADPQVADQPAFSVEATSVAASTGAAPGSTGAVQLDLTQKTDQGWSGEWGLVFVDLDPTGGSDHIARSSIRLYGDVQPTWLNPDVGLTVNEPASIQVSLLGGIDQHQLTPAELVSTVGLDVELRYPDGTSIPVATGLTKEQLGPEQPVTLELEGASSGSAVLRLTLHVTTAGVDGGPGTVLEPAPRDYAVTVAPPPDFPTVAGSVSFGSTDETGTRKASVPITGSGCVWLESAATTSTPVGVDAPRVTSSASSQDTCTSGSLPLELELTQLGTGLASGELTVLTNSDPASATPVPVVVHYDLEVQRPRSAVFWPLLVLITAFGVVIPIGLLYTVKWWTAQIPGSSLLMGSVSGPVTDSGSFVTAASVAEQALQTRILTGNSRRSLVLTSTASIVTRPGLGLTEPGYCVVSGQASVSSRSPGTTGGGTSARLPLAVQDSWVALLSPDDPHTGPVEVVFLVSPTSGRLPELVEDARLRLPELVSGVRTKLADTGTAAAPPPPPDSGTWGAASAPATAPAQTSGGWGSTPVGDPPSTAGPSPQQGGWGSPTTPPPPSGPAGGSSSSYDDW